MVTDQACRKCARQTEADCMMAALCAWKAITLLALLTPQNQAELIAQRQAVAYLHTARSYLGDANRRAEVLLVHGGVQRRFGCFDPQLRFAA